MSLDDVDRQVRQLKEAFMTGSGVVPITRTTEATKKPVDASAPTEPIEDTNGGEGAKPPFAAMVDAAKAALLAGDDPHAAVESMLGHTDEGEPADVSRAVKAALKQLDIKEKEAKSDKVEDAQPPSPELVQGAWDDDHSPDENAKILKTLAGYSEAEARKWAGKKWGELSAKVRADYSKNLFRAGA